MPVYRKQKGGGKPARRASRPAGGSGGPVLRAVTYASAGEAIGAAVQELLKTRGEVSAAGLKLLLSVRLAFCAEEPQQRQILQEALMLMAGPASPA